MVELLSVLYFIGLVMFGAAVANLTGVIPHGFMIIGGGTIMYTIVLTMILYLHKKD
jgi:hypothetical protein